VPGLIDGFASQANQAFANAYLYMGVTSVVTSLPEVPARTDRAIRAAIPPSRRPIPRLASSSWTSSWVSSRKERPGAR
jgi:hypothetical protein